MDRQAIIAELKRRGAFNDPRKKPIIDELRRRGALPPDVEAAASESFDVSTHTGTANVSADTERTILPENVKNLAKHLPTAAAMVAPLPFGEAGGLLGVGQRALAAGAGGAIGETVRQGISAAAGAPEKGGVGKIVEEGAKAAVLQPVGEGALGVVKAGFKGAVGATRAIMDFLTAAQKGTGVTKTAGEAGIAASASNEAVQKYGQQVANAVKHEKQRIGTMLDEAIDEFDAANPEGAFPVQRARKMVREFKKLFSMQEPIPGAPAQVRAETREASGMLSKWISKARAEAEKLQQMLDITTSDKAVPRKNLSLREVKNFIDRVREGIPFDATEPGAAKAARNLMQKITEPIRRELDTIAPKASKAITDYARLIDNSDFVEHTLKITGGEVMDRVRTEELKKVLPNFLKFSESTEQALKEVLTELRRPALAQKGSRLAVKQQLESTPTGGISMLNFPFTIARYAAHPFVRAGMPVIGPTLAAAEKVAERTPASVGGPLVQALFNRRRSNEAKRPR